MLIFSLVLNLILGLLLIVSIYFLVKFVKYSLQYEDSINECLDNLDKSYTNVAELLNRPLLIDTPEVRQIMQELQNAQSSILLVANKISLKNLEKNDWKEKKEDSPASKKEGYWASDVFYKRYTGSNTWVFCNRWR